MSRAALIVDLDKCIGCHACTVACKTANDVALGENWGYVYQVGPHGDFPNIEQYWLPLQCQQCESAPCIEACPTGASYRDEETGLVVIDRNACIGCQLCMSACPYSVRVYNEAANIVDKCSCCPELRAKGEEPACVAACCANARYFGDLDDPASDAAAALAAVDEAAVHALADTGNAPRTRYILSERIATWIDPTELVPASDAVGAPWLKA